MGRVFFIWFKWQPKSMDDDTKMLICEVANSKGIKEAVTQLLPGRRDILLMVLASICVGGVILLFEAQLNSFGRGNILVEVFLKVFLVLFVWALIQLPIYYISLISARLFCSNWIKRQLKVGYKPIVCKMIVKTQSDLMLLWERSYSLPSLLVSANQMSADIKARDVDPRKIGELMIRLLLGGKDSNLNVPTETISMALAKLATLVDAEPKLSDIFCFYLEPTGEITGTLSRNNAIKINCQLGFLPTT